MGEIAVTVAVNTNKAPVVQGYEMTVKKDVVNFAPPVAAQTQVKDAYVGPTRQTNFLAESAKKRDVKASCLYVDSTLDSATRDSNCMVTDGNTITFSDVNRNPLGAQFGTATEVYNDHGVAVYVGTASNVQRIGGGGESSVGMALIVQGGRKEE